MMEQDVLTLATDRILDHKLLDHILLSGFSRIPVHEPGQKDNFVGMLLVKKVGILGDTGGKAPLGCRKLMLT